MDETRARMAKQLAIRETERRGRFAEPHHQTRPEDVADWCTAYDMALNYGKGHVDSARLATSAVFGPKALS